MVLYVSVAIILVFVLWGIISPAALSSTFDSLLGFTTTQFGWFYLLAAVGFLIFSLYLAFSKYGSIKLGKDDDEPEYSNVSWFGMLFSAGMGIGLVFWGVAEPLSHFMNPPMDIQTQTAEAARVAMRYSFFHWSLQPWAIYTIISLALAYFQYRKGYGGLISQVFRPLLGDRVDGWFGKSVDILAVIATAFGVATSLGFGALQINGGLSQLFGIQIHVMVQMVIIALVTVLYLISATTGLDKGIRILSNTNLLIAISLLLLVLFLGPTAFLFDTFTTSLGSYLQNLVQMSLRLTPFSQKSWVANWTLFYWAWWIAWAPFVGTFIARVSKGRTIKEFILGVLIVPSLFSCIWFSVFGGTGLYFDMFHNIPIAEAVEKDTTSALFITLQQLPVGNILSFVATLLIITFFITSADSATFVLGMLSSKGTLNPTNKVKLLWGIIQSSVAVVLILSGGLKGLQTASIITALPFAIVMIGLCFSIKKDLKQELTEQKKKEMRRQRKIDELLEENQ